MRTALALCLGLAACSHGHGAAPGPDAPPADAATADTVPADAGYPATLTGNRDRLLATYYAWLETMPDTAQSNGLVGHDLHGVCDLWAALDPSSQDVFLTLTHRMQGATLADGSHMLDHVTKLYRVIGGQAATATDPGSCGGGEYNRMIMSMDPALQVAQVAANTHQGAAPFDIADIPAGGFWRDSHDAGGPHAPFDLSDETDGGAPRGQTQYFKDPTSAVANAPLGRMDLMTLVDPYALEMDQDYDCTHNSNPGCTYVFYGPACVPETSQAGTAIYTQNYGDFGPTWKPTGC